MKNFKREVEMLDGHFQAERHALGQKLMQALRDNLPFGLKVDLGNGMTAELVPMNNNPEGSQPKRRPIYPEGTPLLLEGDETQPIGYEDWAISFDWKLINCDQDHIEITAKITGGGGFA